MADYLMRGAVTNAINMPSITAEEAPRLKPFVKLAEVLGAFAGQMTDEPIKEIEILFDGTTAEMNIQALRSAALAGLIRPQRNDVNMVSAPIMVKAKTNPRMPPGQTVLRSSQGRMRWNAQRTTVSVLTVNSAVKMMVCCGL